jgi:membrane protein involved in colicin uptake
MPAVAAVAAVGALGYGIYAGERAQKQAQQQYNDARAQAERQRTAEQQQMADNERRQEELYQKQVAEQKSTQDRVRAEIPGMKDQLGADLLTQQEAAYNRMTPQMEARLNALGLLQSGALPEAQAKAQKDLEMQRQAALADFSTSATRETEIARPYEDMKSRLETQRTNLAQTFANQNVYNQNQTATQQYLAGLQAANGSAAQSSANSYINAGSTIGSGLISGYYNKTQPSSLSALDYARKTSSWYGSGNTGPVSPYR